MLSHTTSENSDLTALRETSEIHEKQDPRADLVCFAVGVEVGQPVEALVVLGEAAEAQAEGGDALLRQELALLLQVCGQPVREL